jgi:hypothetical protein
MKSAASARESLVPLSLPNFMDTVAERRSSGLAATNRGSPSYPGASRYGKSAGLGSSRRGRIMRP